jgi:hypothetical protein
MPAVIWAKEASKITLSLASVNPKAESVKMNFGTNVIAGQLKRFYLLRIIQPQFSNVHYLI